jgi:hypothetical protein
MNQKLKGYSADIRKLSLHPIGLWLTIHDLKFVQRAHPEPPVFHAARLGVPWKAFTAGSARSTAC